MGAGVARAGLPGLMQRDDSAPVIRLAREPGKRESRFMHLLGDESDQPQAADATEEQCDLTARVATLEQQVAQLRAQLTQRLQLES